MELNRFSKIVLEVETDHSFINFEGLWTIIIDDDRNEINYSSVQITSSEVTARNRVDFQPDWGFKNDLDAIKLFDELFETNDNEEDKITKCKNVEKLNEFIFKRNMKPSNLITFLGKTNASGALQKSKSGSIRIKKSNFTKNYFGLEEIDEIDGWYFVSLINQIHQKSNIGYTKEEIENIQEIEFAKLFDYGFKNYPWGTKEDKNQEVSFKDALISQNCNNFKDKSLIDAELLIPNKLVPETLLAYIKDPRIDRDIIKEKLRRLWSRNVNMDKEKLFKNKEEVDFVNGLKKFERAHILEEAKVMDKLIELKDNEKKSLELIENLLNKENYILLDETTHSYWDSKDVLITADGKLVKHNCTEHDYEVLTKFSDRFQSSEYLTTERKKLLELRYQFQ